MAEPALNHSTDNAEVYGSFLLAENEFAIAAHDIKDVINAPAAFTRQPLAPEYILGIMTLRDMTLPVIDLRKMFDLPEVEETASIEQKVAIIEYGALHVGIRFDQTGEVFRGNDPRTEFAAYSDHEAGSVTSGAFRFDGGVRIVQLLNTRAVIELDGMPLTRDVDDKNAGMHQSRGPRHQSISFRVSESELAISIEDIQEITTVSEVENLALANGLCIGTTNLRGQTVPLIDLAKTLDFDDKFKLEDLPNKRIIIARTQGMMFGLVVEEICNILHYFTDELLEFPIISVRKPELFLGCINIPGKSEVFHIDVHRLLTSEEVKVATRGSSDLFAQRKQDEDEAELEGRGDAETFLTFHIDRLYAIRILDIIEVVDYPEDMLQPPMLSGHFDGVLNLRGDLISVVNAAKLYEMSTADEPCQQIIIFDCRGTRYGFAIRAIESISHVYDSQRKSLPKMFLDAQATISADVSEAIFHNNLQGEELTDLLILDIEAVAERISPADNEPTPTLSHSA